MSLAIALTRSVACCGIFFSSALAIEFHKNIYCLSYTEVKCETQKMKIQKKERDSQHRAQQRIGREEKHCVYLAEV